MSRNSSKQAQAKGGFTLVELVVVIAVLTILAGVGAVAYNGYIEYAKKGVDRKTVGEVIHALELADYANPDLFQESDVATIYLRTKDGLLCYKRGENDTDDLKSALEDSLGNLDNVRLVYEGWESANNADDYLTLSGSEGFMALVENENSRLNQYLMAEGTAAFSKDMGNYWSEVEGVISAAKERLPEKNNFLEEIVTYSNNNAEDILRAWQDNSKSLQGNSGTYVELARVFAFSSYVQQNYGDQYDDDLEYLKHSLMSLKSNRMSEELKEIRDTYLSSNDSKIDAMAYLGLMEVAGTFTNSAGNFPTDDELIPQLRSTVTAVTGALDKSVSIDELGDVFSTEGGKVVAISVKKQNGTLKIDIPSDIDPREVDNKTQDEGDTGGTCDKSNHTTSMTIDENTPSEITIELCSIDSNYNTCTFNGNVSLKKEKDIFGVIASVSGGKIVVNQKTGAAVVKITLDYLDVTTWLPTTKEITVNVIVH